jgi:SEC-C motif domain protein
LPNSLWMIFDKSSGKIAAQHTENCTEIPLPATNQCPCRVLSQSPLSFAECCEPLINGHTKASTAEQLMRSRYSAYTLGNIDYLIQSWWPDQQQDLDRAAIAEWANNSDWRGLTVHRTERGAPNHDNGRVEFTAYWLDKLTGGQAQLQSHRENSLFKKLNGRWYFVQEDALAEEENTHQPNKAIGRNEPCPCGSGKKFKRCCGA